MWTAEQRIIYRRDAVRYASNLTDAEWAVLEPLIPNASPGGRPRKTDIRAAMNAILYLLRTGCPWRYLPRNELSPRSTALVLDKIRHRFPWLELVWADKGHNASHIEAAVAKVPVLRLEIVKSSDGMKGFVVLPRRWVVERTFSWYGRNRRIAKDYENFTGTLATFVTLACIQIAIRRLAR